MLRDIWIIMLLGGFSLLFVSIFLFFIWRIPELIDDLSGRKAKRQIELMRSMNSSSGPLERFSTGEVYTNMSNGSLLNEELYNIGVGPFISETPESMEIVEVEEEEVVTSDIEENRRTTYLSGNDEETSFMDLDDKSSNMIVVLEELSSL